MDPSSRIKAGDVVKGTRELPPSAFQGSDIKSCVSSQPGNDIVIVVMGPRGSGKGNFVNKLTGCEGELGADNPISPTEGIREFVLDDFHGKRYVVVDTPEFDNSSQSDRDVLRKIADWLRDKYLPHVKITGVIYTHRITDDHTSDSVRENLTEFFRLCGKVGPQQVRLVTTCWDEAGNAETAPSWVSQLEASLRKPPAAADARHERFSNTQKSALEILNGLAWQDSLLTLEELEGAEELSIETSTITEELEGTEELSTAEISAITEELDHTEKQLNGISVTDIPSSRPRKAKIPLSKQVGSWFRGKFWSPGSGGGEPMITPL